MSSYTPLPTSLAARATWCQPDETIRWVFAQRSVRYDVTGLDITGSPLPGWGKRLGQGIKQAAGSVGGTALKVGASLASGDWIGGDDTQRGAIAHELPDITVFGPDPESEAARLLSQQEVARLMGSEEIDLDKLAGDWILTSRRVAILTPVNENTHVSNTSGMMRGALSRASKSIWRKGDEEGRSRDEPNGLSSIFELPVSNIHDIAVAHRTPVGADHAEPGKCFRLTLGDGSGFDFHKPEPAAEHMLEMTRGKS
ncbi:hypothetical protein SAMN04487820_110109 [Actinopolyspora mzabensis]|uniref:Uncharacterized protein n=1 Tax=Actinopolyspora mzabensis TaxID=995066 RepID=A0A1G9DI23_ACTMZ|nr:hypothetical protein [Actinopolyspora mzabensis]SDK63490.1 hypothetical protein SAMN04487820_110109 [Actinopolyspora mzabensis]